MLKFIKKLFKEEQKEITKETVKIDEIEKWIDEKLLNIDLSVEISELLNKLTEQKQILQDKIVILNEAKVSEKYKVENRIRNIVLVNRNNFTKDVAWFFNDLIISEKRDLKTVIAFNTDLNLKLDDLAKKTQKSYQAAQHLFFNEVQAVYKSIGEINLQVNKFKKKLEKAGLDKINELKLTIASLKEEKAKIEVEIKDLKEKKIKKEELTQQIKKIQENAKLLEESEEYKSFNQLNEERKNVEKEIESISNKVKEYFSVLARALRKYQKISLEGNVIQTYIDNPIKAFQEDNELMIISILEQLEKSIKTLNLNEKQEKNCLESIKNSNLLKDIKINHNKLNEKNKELNIKLENIEINKKIKEEEIKLSRSKEELIRLNDEITKLDELINSSQNHENNNKLSELSKTIFNVDLKII